MTTAPPHGRIRGGRDSVRTTARVRPEMLRGALPSFTPVVTIHFAETRPLAEDWIYRFLGAALAHPRRRGSLNGGTPPHPLKSKMLVRGRWDHLRRVPRHVAERPKRPTVVAIGALPQLRGGGGRLLPKPLADTTQAARATDAARRPRLAPTTVPDLQGAPRRAVLYPARPGRRPAPHRTTSPLARRTARPRGRVARARAGRRRDRPSALLGRRRAPGQARQRQHPSWRSRTHPLVGR